MMRYSIKASEEELPRNHAMRSAFCKGAMAWREGQPKTANPYADDATFATAFHRAWNKGWQLSSEEKVEVIIFCQHEGCNQPTMECELPWVYGDPIDKPPEYEYYCAEHAFEHGYCWRCGHFWAGCEGFDFDPGHLCPNCRSEMREEEAEEMEDLLEELE